MDYRGDPHPGRTRKALKFDKDAVIEVLQRDDNWWKGNLHGDEGWFPAQLVQEHRQTVSFYWLVPPSCFLAQWFGEKLFLS